MLQRIEVVASGHSRVLLLGDFNAWHAAWGSHRANTKGEELFQLATELGLETLNLGREATFVGNGVARPSIVDVAFASEAISRSDLVGDPDHQWRLLSRYSYSDHRYVRRLPFSEEELERRRIHLQEGERRRRHAEADRRRATNEDQQAALTEAATSSR
uniref:Endo/exonuclease/phosphatase domain-containing protein n=1 Tax=Anopheles dirus TaxID=7168 RepID=A0A182NPZ4_9DIPT